MAAKYEVIHINSAYHAEVSKFCLPCTENVHWDSYYISANTWQCHMGYHNWVVFLSPSIQLFTDDGLHLHRGTADVDCSLRKKTQLVFNPECLGLTFQAYLDIACRYYSKPLGPRAAQAQICCYIYRRTLCQNACGLNLFNSLDVVYRNMSYLTL